MLYLVSVLIGAYNCNPIVCPFHVTRTVVCAAMPANSTMTSKKNH